MSGYRHLDVRSHGSVGFVHLLDPRLVYDREIQGLVGELNVIADYGGYRTLVVVCTTVESMGSEMLSRLISLQRRLYRKGAKLILCDLRPGVREVCHWTRLDRFFDIQERVEEEEAVALA